MAATEPEDHVYEYRGALRPKNLRLRIVPTGRSTVEGGMFDAVLIFAKGPENTRHEPYELALEVKGLRGSKITLLGPDSLDTKILQPGREDLNVGSAYPDIEVKTFGELTAGDILSRYAGYDMNGTDRVLPPPAHYSWIILAHNYVQVCDYREDGSRVLANCRWNPRGKIDAMK